MAITPRAVQPQAAKGLLAYKEKPADVAAEVSRVMAKASPLMKQAQTAGLQQANRRGLLNSTAAVGAAQAEGYKVAMPIGMQQASQGFQHNLSNQNYQQEGSLAERNFGYQRTLGLDQIDSAERMQGLDIKSKEGMAAAQRNLDQKLLTMSISSNEKMQVKDILSREGIAAADRKLQDLMQQRGIKSTEGMQLKDIESREGMAAAQRALDTKLLTMNLTSAEKMQIKDIGSREGMAAAQRALDAKMQGLDIASREKMQAKDIAAEAARLDKDIAARYGLQAKDIAAVRDNLAKQIKSQEGMQAKDIAAENAKLDKDIAARYGLQAKDIAAVRENLKTDLAQRSKESSLDRQFQASLAKMNLTAAQREQVNSAMMNYMNTYEGALKEINANKDLSSTARANAISSLNARRTNYMTLMSDIYDVDISWPKAAEAAPKPATTAKTAKPATTAKTAKTAKPSPKELAAQLTSSHGEMGGSGGDRL